MQATQKRGKSALGSEMVTLTVNHQIIFIH
jgi:hypothetical protein